MRYEFNVVSEDGNLGKRNLTLGNTVKVRLRLEDLLEPGVIIDNVSVNCFATDGNAQQLEYAADRRGFWYLHVAGDTVLEEQYDVVEVTTSDGQTLAYTIYFEVTGPVTA